MLSRVSEGVLGNQLAGRTALVLCEQVVVEFPVGVRAQIGRFPRLSNDGDIHLLTRRGVHGVERFAARINALDRSFTG